jgi:hypothetical protein
MNAGLENKTGKKGWWDEVGDPKRSENRKISRI